MSASGAVHAPAQTLHRRTAGFLRQLAPAVLAALGLVAEAGAVAIASPGVARWNELAVALAVTAYAAVGLLILWHRPRHRIGWFCVGLAGVWGIGELLVAASYRTLSVDPHAPHAALESVAGDFLRGLPWLLAVMWLPLVFPDGVLPRTRLGRVATGCSALTVAAFATGQLFSPELGDLRLTNTTNPLGLPGDLGRAMEAVAGLSLLLGTLAIGLAVAVLVQRYRRTGALGRQQTLVFGVAFLAPVTALVLSASDAAGPWIFGLTSTLVPLALGAAVLQRRLYDLPLLANRALTYTALWLLIAALYAVAVGGVGALLGQEGAAWLPWAAAGVVAVTFAPLRDALQQAANKLTYGQWARPEDVLSRTSRRLADVADVHALLDELVRHLSDDLGLGAVQVTDARGTVLASCGELGTADELVLTAYGAPVGRLAWRRRELRDTDRRLLENLAGQLGAVVHAQGLLTSLRTAQERLVAAREEERRRLRRDLHDGLGPALAGLSLRVDTVRNVLHQGDRRAAEAPLLALRGGIRETIDEVRRIIEDLRPPALDDLGLVEALRASLPQQPPVCLTAGSLPPLPAAVELAAYRIVQESLANAMRHAHPTRTEVAVRVEGGALLVVVRDDGTGGATPRPGGVGLTSMRERAEEVGGRLVLESSAGSGTTVRATLPLDSPT